MQKFVRLLTKFPKRQKPWHSESNLLLTAAARWQRATTNQKNTISHSNPCYVFCSQIGSKQTPRRGLERAVCHVVTSEGRFTGTRRPLRNTDSLKFICAHVPVWIRLKPHFHHHVAKWEDLPQISLEDTKRKQPDLLFVSIIHSTNCYPGSDERMFSAVVINVFMMQTSDL